MVKAHKCEQSHRRCSAAMSILEMIINTYSSHPGLFLTNIFSTGTTQYTELNMEIVELNELDPDKQPMAAEVEESPLGDDTASRVRLFLALCILFCLFLVSLLVLMVVYIIETQHAMDTTGDIAV
ncbi:uncharacterized protein LOC143806710 [Ranitomeya variabilis]|uniref:uncharacterized protein LOC143806710 n=1 Tax=Ranitomeya variabilis TaxID=490064 RepID=UPI0040567BA6